MGPQQSLPCSGSTSISASICVAFFLHVFLSPLRRTQSYRFRAPPYSNMTSLVCNHIRKNSISKQGRILRCWGQDFHTSQSDPWQCLTFFCQSKFYQPPRTVGWRAASSHEIDLARFSGSSPAPSFLLLWMLFFHLLLLFLHTPLSWPFVMLRPCLAPACTLPSPTAWFQPAESALPQFQSKTKQE